MSEQREPEIFRRIGAAEANIAEVSRRQGDLEVQFAKHPSECRTGEELDELRSRVHSTEEEGTGMADALSRVEAQLAKLADGLEMAHQRHSDAEKEHAGFAARATALLEGLNRRLDILNGQVPEQGKELMGKASREEVAELRKSVEAVSASLKASQERSEGQSKANNWWMENIVKPLAYPVLLMLITSVATIAVSGFLSTNRITTQIDQQNNTTTAPKK